jgi:hypothetical protein
MTIALVLKKALQDVFIVFPGISIQVKNVGSFPVSDFRHRIMVDSSEIQVDFVSLSSITCGYGSDCSQLQTSFYHSFKQFLHSSTSNGFLSDTIVKRARDLSLASLLNITIDASSILVGDLIIVSVVSLSETPSNVPSHVPTNGNTKTSSFPTPLPSIHSTFIQNKPTGKPFLESSHRSQYSVVTVYMGLVSSIMNTTQKFLLEKTMNGWLDQMLLQKNSTFFNPQTIISSQQLVGSLSKRWIQEQKNAEKWRIHTQLSYVQLGINVTWSKPLLPMIDKNDEKDDISFFYHNNETTAILVAIIQAQVKTDPRFAYFTNVTTMSTILQDFEDTYTFPSSSSSTSLRIRIVTSTVVTGVTISFIIGIIYFVWMRRYVLV